MNNDHLCDMCLDEFPTRDNSLSNRGTITKVTTLY